MLFVVLFLPILFIEKQIEFILKPYTGFNYFVMWFCVSLLIVQFVLGLKLLFTKGQTTYKKLIWFFLKVNIIINFIIFYSNNKLHFGILILITNLITTAFIFNWYVKNKSFKSITN